jgi:hypothetical protein
VRCRDRRLVGHSGQHLGHVPHLDAFPVTRELAGHVHQATEVTRQQGAGTGRARIRGLLGNDSVGDLGILDAERSAKPAADVSVLHFGQGQVGNGCEQPARLRLHAEFAQTRAGIVIGHGTGELCVGRGYAHDVNQE